MKDFKEWLSDYLRYFLLAAIIILIIGAAVSYTHLTLPTTERV